MSTIIFKEGYYVIGKLLANEALKYLKQGSSGLTIDQNSHVIDLMFLNLN